ncbi:MAG: hypothetical protein ACRDRP_08650 [Pseudonocardiaceae bacterium]
MEHARFVIVRISACGEVSLRDGDSGGDAVSLTARDATALMDAISAAFARTGPHQPGRWPAGLRPAHCLACYGSLAAGQLPTSPGGTCGAAGTSPPAPRDPPRTVCCDVTSTRLPPPGQDVVHDLRDRYPHPDTRPGGTAPLDRRPGAGGVTDPPLRLPASGRPPTPEGRDE